MVKLLEDERLTLFITKSLVIAECLYVNRPDRITPNTQENIEDIAKATAKQALYEYCRDMNLETKRYFETCTDDLKEFYKKTVNLPDLLLVDINLEQNIRRIAKEVKNELAIIIPKLTVEPLKLIQEQSRIITANSQMKSIIEGSKVTTATKATAEILDRDKVVPPESFKDAVKTIAEETVRKRLKEHRKRQQKNSSGGRKDLPPKPGSNGHASKKNSKQSPKKKKKNSKQNNQPKKEDKVNGKTGKRKNDNPVESNKGKPKKQKKK